LLVRDGTAVINPRSVAVACLAIHLGFVLLVCSRDIFAIVSDGHTVLQGRFESAALTGKAMTSAALGERLSASNPARQCVTSYLHGAGIETGYSFFAPNVPNSLKLVFELHYPDGRIEYDLPHVASHAAGLRLNGLLEYIARTSYEDLREFAIKRLVYSSWEGHPTVTRIRAVLGVIDLPTVDEVEQGKKHSNEYLYVYDFVFTPRAR
jgi:hypothetical protein